MSKYLTPAHEGTVEHLPLEAITALLGDLNTEAKCATLIATPYDAPTPIAHVLGNLASFDAFTLTSDESFNPWKMLEQMNDAVVRTVSDPTARRNEASTYVEKTRHPVGEFATALAGALLAFSLDNNRPLRNIIGERRRAPVGSDAANSIDTRLGVLAAIYHHQHHGKPRHFGRKLLGKELSYYGFTASAVKNHFNALLEIGWIEPAPTKDYRSPKFKLAVKHVDGHDQYEELGSFLRLIGDFAIGSHHAINEGLRRGQEIVTDASVLPLLIQRSYANSGHTGKTFERN